MKCQGHGNEKWFIHGTIGLIEINPKETQGTNRKSFHMTRVKLHVNANSTANYNRDAIMQRDDSTTFGAPFNHFSIIIESHCFENRCYCEKNLR